MSIKAIILWQIAALLFLPAYPLAPISSTVKISQADQEGITARHPCGCPAERVLSRTCCCFLSGGRCFAASKPVFQKRPGDRTRPIVYCVAPCGWPAKINANASVSLEFLQTDFTFTQAHLFTPVTTIAEKTPEALFNPPQVPPPEIMAAAFLAAI